jgi:type IV fimbrial biogenesis protein FimT
MTISIASPKKFKGFSLIELLTIMALVAILGVLAVPSMVDYGIRNTLRSIGNDFSGSVLKSRNEAISRNTCVTMCMSTTVDTAIAGTSGPVCSATGDDWQVGWIVFLNESCNTSWTYPHTSSTDTNYDEAGLIISKRAVNGTYYLMTQTSGRRRLDFNPRGSSGLSGATEFDLIFDTPNNPKTLQYAFNICLDALGRTRTIPSGSACANY